MDVMWLGHALDREHPGKVNYELFVDTKPTNWWVKCAGFWNSDNMQPGTRRWKAECTEGHVFFIGVDPLGEVHLNKDSGTSWAFLEDAKESVLKLYKKSLGEVRL